MSTICFMVLAGLILCAVLGVQAYAGPNAAAYRPYLFWHAKDPFHIETYGWYAWPDKRAGAEWAICYWFVWNDESDYPGRHKRKDRKDPEPVIVFVNEKGAVVGVQTRAHGVWLPIAPVGPQDMHGNRHVFVYFSPMPGPLWVHTPILGRTALGIAKELGKKRLVVEKGINYVAFPVSKKDYPLH